MTIMQRGSAKRRGLTGSAPIHECRPDALTLWVHACSNALRRWTATATVTVVFAKLCAIHERALAVMEHFSRHSACGFNYAITTSSSKWLDAQPPSPTAGISTALSTGCSSGHR